MASVASSWLTAGLSVGCTIFRPELGSLAPTLLWGSNPSAVKEETSGFKAERVQWVCDHKYRYL